MKIELLVSAIENGDNPKAIRKYDVLTAQKANHDWGTGDLAGRFVFVVDESVPCESVEPDRRCSKCEYMGVEWSVFPPIPGTKGVPKRTCPIQKYANAHVNYEYDIDIHGIPYIKHDVIKNRGSSVDYTALLSQASINACEKEKKKPNDLIPEGIKIAKLALARNPANEISVSNIRKHFEE